jgi:UPF0271 protein
LRQDSLRWFGQWARVSHSDNFEGEAHMSKAVNLNADIGESFGAYRMPNDDALLGWIRTANIACGYHAGDPSIMRETVDKAVEKGVDIGAHVALPDLMGFGRRRMEVSPEELTNYILYQLGALDAFVRRSGGSMVHVKPHGSLAAMCSEDEGYADALLRAMTAFDRNLMLILVGDLMERVAAPYGVRMVHEGYCDLAYRPDGSDIIERVKKPWDPQEVAKRALRLVEMGTAVAVDGTEIRVRADTICIHGDAANAAEVGRTVVETLRAHGVSIVGLRELA